MSKQTISSTLFIIVLLLINNALTVRNKFKTRDTCGKGFGFSGNCISTSTGLTSYKGLPSNASNIINGVVLPMINALSAAPTFCVGDWSGTDITSLSFQQYSCDEFPIDTSYKYGIIAGLVRNVPCGTPQTVTMCIIFDQCGTFGISINGGVLACAATYSTGIGAILGTVSDAIDFISFGISTTKKYQLSFKLAYNDGGNVTTKTVTTKGHIYLGLGLSFPADWLKINGKSLEDIIALNIKGKLLVDLGNVSSVITDTINSFSTLDNHTATNVGSNLLKLGSEVTLEITGQLVILFEDLTNGFIPDFEVTIGYAALLATKGSGESGLPAGMYLYLGTDIAQALMNTIQDFIDHFSDLIGFVGVSLPSIPSTGSSVGLFIQSSSMGIEFSFAGIKLKCLYYYGSKGSCKFSDKYITALINAGKWVIKKAGAFFDETGDEIASFAKDSAKFAKNLATGVANKIADNKATQAVVSTAKKAGKCLKSLFSRKKTKC
jgi:hypothetical protein